MLARLVVSSDQVGDRPPAGRRRRRIESVFTVLALHEEVPTISIFNRIELRDWTIAPAYGAEMNRRGVNNFGFRRHQRLAGVRRA